MYHKIIIVGNLGRDPEMRYTPDGTPVTSFSVAANQSRKNNDGTWGKETIWFRVTVWNRQAEIAAQYLSKGRAVLVEGRLRPDPATGGPKVYQRQDGSHGAQYEVTASRIVFLSGRGEAAQDSMAAPPAEGEDIPF